MGNCSRQDPVPGVFGYKTPLSAFVSLEVSLYLPRMLLSVVQSHAAHMACLQTFKERLVFGLTVAKHEYLFHKYLRITIKRCMEE